MPRKCKLTPPQINWQKIKRAVDSFSYVGEILNGVKAN
jgi:hypothetical protein